MMAAALLLDWALNAALGLLSLALLMTVVRVIIGPTLPDRVMALDMLVAIAIGFIAVLGIRTGQALYADIAIALGLVGFLATVAFARFILQRRSIEEDSAMIDALQNYVAAVLVLIGSLFALTASIGLLRLPDFYTSMHAASKAGTLGSCVMLIALAVYADDLAVTLRALGGVVFFLLTAPVSAHLLAKAAHGSGLRLVGNVGFGQLCGGNWPTAALNRRSSFALVRRRLRRCCPPTMNARD